MTIENIMARIVYFLVLAWDAASAVVADDYNKSLCEPRPHNISNPYPEPDPQAPDRFTVSWRTTVDGEPIVLEVVREWAPLGVDRFYQLILDHYYDCAAFFRVVPGFVVQFGIASDPDETIKWNTSFADDPVLQSNTYGYVSYATDGPDTRTTQIFINLANNSRLDADGFSPFAKVVSGMDTVLAIYNPTPGNRDGIDQGNYTEYGNAYILEYYPSTDLIKGVPELPNATSSSMRRGMWVVALNLFMAASGLVLLWSV